MRLTRSVPCSMTEFQVATCSRPSAMVWSRAWSRRCFVPMTPMGDRAAISSAILMASAEIQEGKSGQKGWVKAESGR